MVRIGNTDYPNTWEKLLTNRPTMSAFREYAKKNGWENYRFLTIKFDPKKDYDLYIKRRGKFWINLPDTLREPMDDLASRSDWKAAAWKSHIKKARESIIHAVENDHFKCSTDKFWKSKEFGALHRPKVVKSAKKAASLLGIAPRNLNLLVEVMIAVSMGDKREAKKYSELLKKSEDLELNGAELQAQLLKML